MEKKYFKTKKEAIKALEERRKKNPSIANQSLGVFKMSKGTRHHGMYAVCSEFEWLNTY